MSPIPSSFDSHLWVVMVPDHKNELADKMSISAISGLAHHIPQTHQAKVDDEHKEALAIKVKEVQAAKDLVVQVGFLKPEPKAL